SATWCHALIGWTLTIYEFNSNTGQPTIFDGSTVMIGVPSVNIPDVVFGFDIKDPNAVGGEVISDPSTFNVIDITSSSPTGWTGSATIDYTKAWGGTGTLTITGTDPTGSINDTDPTSANGVWTPVSVPDQANTMLLLGSMTGLFVGMRHLPARSRLRRMLVPQACK